MNFFAHLVVARRERREPAYLLGAMLPDFATMSATRLGTQGHQGLALGVAEHHRTDEAFHASESFVAICREMGARLEQRGLSWGAARAVAHVGTELFLDGELTDDVAAAADYTLAIEAAGDTAIGPHITFRDEQGRARFEQLHTRLRTHGVPRAYKEPAFVADVLVRILSSRPRLAVQASQREVLEQELRVMQERVLVARESLMQQTLDALTRRASLGEGGR